MRTNSGSESGLRPASRLATDMLLFFLPSPASGVGNIATAIAVVKPNPLPFFFVAFKRARRFSIACKSFGSNWLAVGVGHVAGDDPHSLPDVRRVDGCSRNNNRPAGVAVGFQVSEHLVEPQGDVTSNVLSKDPSGSDFANNSAHCRPEVARVILAGALAGVAERLAGVTSGDDIDPGDSIGSKPGSV